MTDEDQAPEDLLRPVLPAARERQRDMIALQIAADALGSALNVTTASLARLVKQYAADDRAETPPDPRTLATPILAAEGTLTAATTRAGEMFAQLRKVLPITVSPPL